MRSMENAMSAENTLPPAKIIDADFNNYLKETNPDSRGRLTYSYITSMELKANREKIKSFNDSRYKSSPESLDNYRVLYETSSGGFQTRELPESRLNEMIDEFGKKHTFPSESGTGTKMKNYHLGLLLPMGENFSPDEEVGFVIELHNPNKIFEMRRIMKDGKIHYLDNRELGGRGIPKIRRFSYKANVYINAIALRGKAEDFSKTLFSLCNVKSVHMIVTKKKTIYN